MASPTRALPGAHVPRIVPLLNPLVRRFMGAGLPFGPNVLLTVRGRRRAIILAGRSWTSSTASTALP